MRFFRRWIAGSLFVTALLCSPQITKAQLTGNFSLEKTTFAPGEPVFLSLAIRNDGMQPENIFWSNTYSQCSYIRLKVFRNGQEVKTCFPPTNRTTWASLCMTGGMHLDPHSAQSLRILLNYPNAARGYDTAPVDKPGEYTIEASTSFSDDTRMKKSSGTGTLGATSQTLAFRVSETEQLSPEAYLPFVKELKDENSSVREEAARTLASLAPRSLEALLLTFADSQDDSISQFAPLALYNLSTEASLSALAQILLHREAGTYEYSSAANYLAKTHDKKWFPVLLSVATKDHPIYLLYAAEAGGEAALPTLLERFKQDNTATIAIEALGYTGCRSAVPLLIDMLRPKAGNDLQPQADAANHALELLTHKRASRDYSNIDYSTLYNRWLNWWNSSRESAPIYLPETCISYSELP